MHSELVFLLTPQHSGTHFARLLLEIHPQLDYCVIENRRINTSFHAGCVLRGTGAGPAGPPDERMLDPYFVEFLCGKISLAEFGRCIDYYCSISAEWCAPSTNYEQLARSVRGQLAQIGIKQPPKRPRYTLLHGHAGPKYRGEVLSSDCRFVVATRHPLLSFVSRMRRTGRPADASDLIAAWEVISELPTAFYICTDIWASAPEKLLKVFKYLDIDVPAECLDYAKKYPVINSTVDRNDVSKHPLQVREPRDADPIFINELREAKRLLVEDAAIHPILRPYWRELRSSRVINFFESLGYDFTRLHLKTMA